MSTASIPPDVPCADRGSRRAVGRIGAAVSDLVVFALTRDLCPAAARWERWVRRPIVLLAMMLVMAVALAAFANPVSATTAFALVAVLAVGHGWPAIVIRGLSAELRFAGPRGVEGEIVPAVVTVRNTWPFPVWGIAIEADIGGRERVALEHLPPRSTTEFRWECLPRCRGEFPRGGAEIVTGFPFGISFARRGARVDRTVVIWPATVPLESLPDAGESAATDEAVSDRRVGDAGDVIGTRPFRRGDPLRRVHWPLTARTGALVTCERQAPLATAVRVIVDCDPAGHDAGGPTGSLENAIRVAASICRGYQLRGARVECRLGRERLEVAPGRQGLVRFLDALARRRPEEEPGGAAHGPRPVDGGLEIEITTPRGLGSLRGRRTGDASLVIVIEPPDFSADPPPVRRVVRLVSGPDTLAEFARRWRGIRHAG
jgi:uncharacterized protein (DUF58 family)